MEQKGKMVAQEEGSKANNAQQDSYTRPPRVSFGFELEFLVCRIDNDNPDVDEDIPGLAPPIRDTDGYDAVRKLLYDHGFCTNMTEIDCPPSSEKQMWIVKSDPTVFQEKDQSNPPSYNIWDSVEISSPPMYACEEAYNLISVVVRLLTTNLRLRVNATCGFHVHVGNGPHQLDTRALRNYAALLWASEPVLSTLHCPERSFSFYAKSIRRWRGIHLTTGETAEDARREILAGPRIVPRYVSRARHLGEHPFASHVALRQRLRSSDDGPTGLELDDDSDESNWEAEDSKPFERPKRLKGARRETLDEPHRMELCSEASAGLLDSQSTRRGLPPQIDFPISEVMASGHVPVGAPLLDDQRKAKKAVSYHDISERQRHGHKLAEAKPGENPEPDDKLAWKGVTELLACDIGVHQIAYLMTDEDDGRYFSSNWLGQTTRELFPIHNRVFWPTIESRVAAGSLDAEWIVIWIKIQCRLLEWARDADPAQFMSVIGKLSHDDHSQELTYDVLDFLRDIGMYTELKCCQERLRRSEEAWHECVLMGEPPSEAEKTKAKEGTMARQEMEEEEDLYTAN